MDDKQYRGRLIHALTIIGSGLAVIAVIMLLENWSTFSGGISTFGKAISSLIYGAVFAFLLNPFVRFADKGLRPLMQKTNLTEKRANRVSRAISVVFAYIIGALLIYAFVSLIVPQLYLTILGLVETMPGYYANAETWIMGILADNAQLSGYVDIFMERAYDYVESFIHDDLLSSAQQIMLTVTSSLYSFVVGALNMALGLIASIYILMTKDTLLAQSKKIVVACFRSGTADELMEIGRRIHKIFNGFIVGKLLDSLIMAILSYIILQIMNMPFALLLATIIGVTNVIPYFGPFIGAVPCAILVLLVSPIQCFYFVIFILIMQQIDGNII
ncbi:MAG: AI-2E family transporter, partial [Eubacteriales bacterium]